ncbi:MAG: serine/threonine-protein kinase, partial [Myxococcota bacterium]
MEHAFTQVDIAGVEGLRDHTDGSALFKAGTCIGQYRITEAIGRGGFGTVWRAFDLANGRQVAIKVLRPEYVTQPDILARFKREARVAAMLEHENIAELYEIGKLPDGTPYIVMEYLFGDSLHVYLRSQGVLPPSSVGEVLRQLSSALSEAHAHGVVHRDIKSSNVMVCTKPDGGVRLVLLDFGIAKLLGCREPPITAPLTTIGSPHFMAPEQIYHNGVDARTDVYGLGVLAFELLTGKLPFQGHVSSVLCAHLEEKRPLPSNCDPTLLPFDPIIQRAMALDPAERYGSTDDFLLAFNRALRTHRGGPASCPATLLHTAAVGIYIQTELDLDRAVSCDAVQQAQAEDAAIDEIIAAIAHAARFLKKCGFISAYDYGNQSLFVL